MKRSELEKHIGESVEVKLFDGDTMQGVLRKTGTEEVRNNPNLYLKGLKKCTVTFGGVEDE